MTQHFLLQGYRPITFWSGYRNPHNPHGTWCKVPELYRGTSRCQQVSRHVLLAVTSSISVHQVDITSRCSGNNAVLILTNSKASSNQSTIRIPNNSSSPVSCIRRFRAAVTLLTRCVVKQTTNTSIHNLRLSQQ